MGDDHDDMSAPALRTVIMMAPSLDSYCYLKLTAIGGTSMCATPNKSSGRFVAVAINWQDLVYFV
jgi:hypothetical protein